MKTCPGCHRGNAEARSHCVYCGVRLSGNSDVEVAKIDFLLGELEEWQRRGLVWGAAFETLRGEYETRRASLLGAPKARVDAAKLAPPKPTHKPSSVDLVQDLLKSTQYTMAVEVCSELLTKYPRSAKLFSLRATAQERSGHIEQARDDAMRAWELDQRNPEYIEQARRLQHAVREPVTASEPTGSPVQPVQPAATVESPQPRAVPHPPSTAPSTPQSRVEDQKPEFDWIGWLNAFLEERNIQKGWVLVGLLMVGGFIGLVQQTWGVVGKYILYLGLLAATGGSYFGGKKLTRLGEGWRVSGFCLMTLGLLLLPVDVIALRQTLALDAVSLGLLTSVLCLIAYSTATWNRRIEGFAYLTGAAALSTLYFLLHKLAVPTYDYGLFTMPLAFVALYFGWRWQATEHRVFSRPLIHLAHGTVAMTYIAMIANWQFFLTGGIFQAVGVVAMGTALYVASAYLFDEIGSVYLSAALAVVCGFLLVRGLQPETAWQNFRIVGLLVSAGFLGASLASEEALKRNTLATGYRISCFVLAGVLVAAIAGEGVVAIGVQLLPQPSPQLLSTIIVSLFSAALYAAMAYLFRRSALVYVTGGLFAYAMFLLMIQSGVPLAWWSVGLVTVAWGYWLIAWRMERAEPDPKGPNPKSQIQNPQSAISLFVPPLHDTAYVVAAIAGVVAVGIGLWHADEWHAHLSSAITMLALSALYVMSAWLTSNPSWLHATILTGGFGIWFAALLPDWNRLIQLGLPDFFIEPNAGWQVCGFVALLTLIGWALWRRNQREHSLPFLQWSSVVGMLGLLSLVFHYAMGDCQRSVAAALYVYAAISLVSSVLFREVEVPLLGSPLPTVLTYLTAVLIPLAQVCQCEYYNLGWAPSSLITAILGLVYFLSADTLSRLGDGGLWSRPLFNTSHVLAGVSSVIALGNYYGATTFDIAHQIAVRETLMVLSTFTIALLISLGGVALQRGTVFAYTGPLYGLALYATMLHRLPALVNAAERNYGLLFIPYVLVLLGVAALTRNRKELAAGPCVCAAVVAAISLIWQVPYEFTGLHGSVLAVLLVYAALVVAGSLFMKIPEGLYGVTALLAWSVFHGGIWAKQPVPLIGLEQGILAWALLGLALVLIRREAQRWAIPIARSALLLSVVGTLVCVAASPHDTPWATAITIMLATLLYCFEGKRSGDVNLGCYPSLLLLLFYARVIGAAGALDPWNVTPALFAAVVYFSMSYLTGERPFCWLSVAALWWSWLLCWGYKSDWFVWSVGLLVAVGAVVYAWFAERWKDERLAYAAAVTFSMIFAGACRVLHVPLHNAALSGVAFTAALTIGGYAFETLRMPFRRTAMMLSLMIAATSLVASHDTMVEVLISYSVLYFAAAWFWRSMFSAYAAPAAASLCLFLHCVDRGVPTPQGALMFSGLSLLWGLLALPLRLRTDRGELARVLIAFACGTAAVSAIAAFGGAISVVEYGRYGAYALIVDAVVFGLLWYLQREHALLHVSYFCLMFAYFLPLLEHHVTVPDAYAIPIGLYLIALGFMGQRTGSAIDANGLYTVGLLITLSSSFLSAMPARAFLHHLLLMCLTVAATAVGISQRLRTFLVQGTGFLVVFLLYRVSGVLPDIRVNWAFYAIGLAVALAVALLAFNAKREQIVAAVRKAQDQWAAFH